MHGTHRPRPGDTYITSSPCASLSSRSMVCYRNPACHRLVSMNARHEGNSNNPQIVALQSSDHDVLPSTLPFCFHNQTSADASICITHKHSIQGTSARAWDTSLAGSRRNAHITTVPDVKVIEGRYMDINNYPGPSGYSYKTRTTTHAHPNRRHERTQYGMNPLRQAARTQRNDNTAWDKAKQQKHQQKRWH